MKEKSKNSYKVVFGIAIVAIIIVLTNVYASTNGYGNIFFMIRSIFGDTQEVSGQENLLSDRDITISYTSMEIAEGIKVQIQRMTLEQNKATMYVYVQNDKKTELKYKAYDESNNLLAEYTGTKGEMYYTDKIEINQTINENAKIRLEVYNSSNKLLKDITVDLVNRELVVGNEKVEKLSEIELKEYLGVFAGLSAPNWEQRNIKNYKNCI